MVSNSIIQNIPTDVKDDTDNIQNIPTVQTAQNDFETDVKDDSDNDLKDESPIVEDLNDISDCTTVTAIPDWDKRFKLANYTQEQRRIVHLSNENMRAWFEVNDKTDWTEQLNENGLTVFYRNS